MQNTSNILPNINQGLPRTLGCFGLYSHTSWALGWKFGEAQSCGVLYRIASGSGKRRRMQSRRLVWALSSVARFHLEGTEGACGRACWAVPCQAPAWAHSETWRICSAQEAWRAEIAHHPQGARERRRLLRYRPSGGCFVILLNVKCSPAKLTPST